MQKIPTTLEFLKVDASPRPELIEDTRQMFIYYGTALSGALLAVLINWDFKCYDTTNGGKLILDARLNQQHRINGSENITVSDIAGMISESHNDSTELVRTELKKIGISHQITGMPSDVLESQSKILFDEIQKRRK
jgi:hypothetical protein